MIETIWQIVAENPLASMMTFVAALVAGYVSVTLYHQHQEEVAMRAQLDQLRRERDELWKDLR